MSEVEDLTSRLGSAGASGSWGGAMWVVVVLGLLFLFGVAAMYYRDWHIKRAWKSRPQKNPVPFCGGTRVAGLTLAEVRRAQKAARPSEEDQEPSDSKH